MTVWCSLLSYVTKSLVVGQWYFINLYLERLMPSWFLIVNSSCRSSILLVIYGFCNILSSRYILLRLLRTFLIALNGLHILWNVLYVDRNNNIQSPNFVEISQKPFSFFRYNKYLSLSVTILFSLYSKHYISSTADMSRLYNSTWLSYLKILTWNT